jgi:hypothetical protein
VLLENGFQFRPDGIMAADVFGFGTRVDLHDKSFAYHGENLTAPSFSCTPDF